jgi:hypothetical protein
MTYMVQLIVIWMQIFQLSKKTTLIATLIQMHAFSLRFTLMECLQLSCHPNVHLILEIIDIIVTPI